MKGILVFVALMLVIFLAGYSIGQLEDRMVLNPTTSALDGNVPTTSAQK